MQRIHDNDSKIESMIQDKGLNAPRVTPAQVEAVIASESYINAGAAAGMQGQPKSPSMDQLTFCILTLKNGFTVTGESACASPENFNEDVGRAVARENAINKIWPLLGYQLKTLLAAAQSSSN